MYISCHYSRVCAASLSRDFPSSRHPDIPLVTKRMLNGDGSCLPYRGSGGSGSANSACIVSDCQSDNEGGTLCRPHSYVLQFCLRACSTAICRPRVVDSLANESACERECEAVGDTYRLETPYPILSVRLLREVGRMRVRVGSMAVRVCASLGGSEAEHCKNWGIEVVAVLLVLVVLVDVKGETGELIGTIDIYSRLMTSGRRQTCQLCLVPVTSGVCTGTTPSPPHSCVSRVQNVMSSCFRYRGSWSRLW
jgi:hypothetical protein